MINDQTTPTESDSTWSSYFTRNEWILYGLIVLLGLILRWTLLDLRPYHHDESLHGMYGRYFYDFPNANYYKYDPMLHGPMLYNCMRFIYSTFGDSLWAARTPVCIMGSLFMFAPFVFRSFFGKRSVLIFTAAVALSPSLVYWSRFLREDSWVISGMLLSLYGFMLAPARLKTFFVLFGITIQWCSKENIFVTIAVVMGYLVFEALFRNFILSERDSIAKRIVHHVGTHPWQTCWAFVFCFLVFSWFYSAGFRYPDGILDGLGKKGFEYWLEHHNKERIEGPFNFPLYMLGWYELPFLIAYLVHIVLFYRRARPEIQFAGAAVLVALLIACFVTNPAELKESWKFFKLKDHYDLVGLFIVLFHSPIVTVHHLLRREHGLAALGYFFTSTLFVYCYLGEKVPWLSIYPLTFGLPYLVLYFQDYFTQYPVDYRRYPLRNVFLYLGCTLMAFGFIFILEEWNGITWAGSIYPEVPASISNNALYLAFGALFTFCALFDHWDSYLGHINIGRALVIVASLFSIRAAIQTNFTYTGKETEYISQVHTTYDVAEVAQRIVEDALFERPGYRPKVLVTGEATWPLSWYFRHLRDEYRFNAKPDEKANFTYIFQDWKDTPDPGTVPEGYSVRKLNLRGWWVPDFRQMTLKKFLNFSVNHYPWSPSGFTYTTLLVANDTGRFKNK